MAGPPSERRRVGHRYASPPSNASTHIEVLVRLPVTLGVILARSKTGFRKTDTVLNRLIRGAIQTGLFAGIFSLGDLITFVCWPATNFYGMFAIPIGRIYTNVSLLPRSLQTRRRDRVLTTVPLTDALGHADEPSGAPCTASRYNRRRRTGDYILCRPAVHATNLLQGQAPPSLLRWARATTVGSTTQGASTTNIQLGEIEVQKEVMVFGDGEAHDARDSKAHVSSVEAV